MDDVKVYVINKGRKNLYLRFIDPMTGKAEEKSAKTSKHSKALMEAGSWQKELQNGRYPKPSRMAWEVFREHYAANALPALAASTGVTYEATLNVFERTCNPKKLADVSTSTITRFVTELRTQGLSEATVGRHLRQLKAILRWANRQGLLNVLPQIDMPKRAKGAKVMRGRPITCEEFDRMIKAVPKVVENAAASSWKFYLRGLWESGLRLSESLVLRWDNAPGAIVVDLDGRRPMLRIPAEAEKGNRDRLLPITPEFAKLLVSVPERERRGRVFKLLANDATLLPTNRTIVGKIVSAIGEAAGVVVDEREKRLKDERDRSVKTAVKKFASAHDLRRAFGFRWSMRVMPTVLKELMRHEDISTTMKFYVGQNAEATADAVWATVGDTLGDTHSANKKRDAKRTANSSTGERT